MTSSRSAPMDKRVSVPALLPLTNNTLTPRTIVTTTSTETYEIMTRSICATSMSSVPCYVCAFGLPSEADLMTVTVVSSLPTTNPFSYQAVNLTIFTLEIEHGKTRPYTNSRGASLRHLQARRNPDSGRRSQSRRPLLRMLPLLRRLGSIVNGDYDAV